MHELSADLNLLPCAATELVNRPISLAGYRTALLCIPIDVTLFRKRWTRIDWIDSCSGLLPAYMPSHSRAAQHTGWEIVEYLMNTTGLMRQLRRPYCDRGWGNIESTFSRMLIWMFIINQEQVGILRLYQPKIIYPFSSWYFFSVDSTQNCLLKLFCVDFL